MPKKDTAAAVLGMLSTAGAQTRKATEGSDDSERSSPPPPVTVTERSPMPVSTPPPARRPSAAAEVKVPRTLRLRSTTAERLRQAWLHAKRDDVLLTAQDFASDLVEDALVRRRRSAARGAD